MASARFVSELARGGRVNGIYLMQSKELRVARTGDAYLSCVLADRSGSIPAVLFRPARTAVEIPAGAVVAVSGTVTSFKGVRRVTADEIAPAATWEPEDLLAASSRPTEELTEEFTRLVKSVANRQLRQLLRSVFGEGDFFERFKTSPATQDAHHAFRGGLLEHTVSVAWLCVESSRRYDVTDPDVLLASALLHDIGVVDELRFDAGILKTDRGRLLGHESLGVLRVHDAARQAQLPADTASLIEHAVLTHHRDDSLGAGGPLTLETVALRRADTTDIVMAEFTVALNGASRAGEGWTGAQNPFGRSLRTTAIREPVQPVVSDCSGSKGVQHSA